MSRLYPLLALLLLATSCHAKAEQVPLYREIKDWVVACDNLRNCQAVSAPEGFQHSPLRLSIQRDAGAQGHLQLRLKHAGQREDLPVRTDGRPLPDHLAYALRLETAGANRFSRPRAKPRVPCLPSGATAKRCTWTWTWTPNRRPKSRWPACRPRCY